MKVIIADAGDYIGLHILRRCMFNFNVTCIIAISNNHNSIVHHLSTTDMMSMPEISNRRYHRLPQLLCVDLKTFCGDPSSLAGEIGSADIFYWVTSVNGVVARQIGGGGGWPARKAFQNTISFSAECMKGYESRIRIPRRFVLCVDWEEETAPGFHEQCWWKLSPTEESLLDCARRSDGNLEAYTLHPVVLPQGTPHTAVTQHRIPPEELARKMVEIGKNGANRKILGHLELLIDPRPLRHANPRP